MIQIRIVVLVLQIFKSGNFFLAHPVELHRSFTNNLLDQMYIVDPMLLFQGYQKIAYSRCQLQKLRHLKEKMYNIESYDGSTVNP